MRNVINGRWGGEPSFFDTDGQDGRAMALVLHRLLCLVVLSEYVSKIQVGMCVTSRRQRKIEKLVGFTKFPTHVLDRYEIYIHDLGDFI